MFGRWFVWILVNFLRFRWRHWIQLSLFIFPISIHSHFLSPSISQIVQEQILLDKKRQQKRTTHSGEHHRFDNLTYILSSLVYYSSCNSICLYENGMIYWPQSAAYLVHLEQKRCGAKRKKPNRQAEVGALLNKNSIVYLRWSHSKSEKSKVWIMMAVITII